MKSRATEITGWILALFLIKPFGIDGFQLSNLIMEISISEEQDYLLKVAEQSMIPPLLEEGNVFPSVFVHTGDEVRFYQFQVGQDNDTLRELVAETIREKCPNYLAYALGYDSSIDGETGPLNALIIETGDEEDERAVEFAVTYDRKKGTHETRKPISTLPSLLRT